MKPCCRGRIISGLISSGGGCSVLFFQVFSVAFHSFLLDFGLCFGHVSVSSSWIVLIFFFSEHFFFFLRLGYVYIVDNDHVLVQLMCDNQSDQLRLSWTRVYVRIFCLQQQSCLFSMTVCAMALTFELKGEERIRELSGKIGQEMSCCCNPWAARVGRVDRRMRFRWK